MNVRIKRLAAVIVLSNAAALMGADKPKSIGHTFASAGGDRLLSVENADSPGAPRKSAERLWKKTIELCNYPGDWQQANDSRSPAPSSPEENELAAFQGTWLPLQYEEKGRGVQGAFNFKQIIKGDKVTFQVNGETKAEGTVVVDSTTTVKHFDVQFSSGQKELVIYVRIGDSIVCCGNRDGKTRPSKFACGTEDGGEYLVTWKIEK